MVDVASVCAAYRTPYTGSGGAFGGLDGLDCAEVRAGGSRTGSGSG